MQNVDGRLVYSATDLVGYLECEHLTSLEQAAVAGHLPRPMQADPVLDRITQRGELHEARFLESLRAEGVTVDEVESDQVLPQNQRIARGRDTTLAAMREGAGAIYQAVLFDGSRLGYADFLRRVETPSALGPWSYEVWDTKLARHAKASAVLQLCMYSDMLGDLQDRPPVEMHLALGGVQGERISFRVADYAAYYRLVAREFEAILGRGSAFPLATTPEPVEHCDVCRWSLECRAQWRAQDDLSLVAGLTSRQRRALHSIDVTTRTGLAETAEPLPQRLDGAGPDALKRVHAQAQHTGARRARRSNALRVHRAAARPRRRPGPRPRSADAPGAVIGRPVLRHRGRPHSSARTRSIASNTCSASSNPDLQTQEASRSSTHTGQLRAAPLPRGRSGARLRHSLTS